MLRAAFERVEERPRGYYTSAFVGHGDGEDAYARGRLGRCAGRNLPLARAPLPCVPLSDEAAPILNRQLEGALARAEGRAPVAFGRRREQVEPFKISLREVDGLAARDQRVRARARGELEAHAAEEYVARQHLRREAPPRRVEASGRLLAVRA